MRDKKLGNTKLRDEGLNLLAISRKDGTFLGAPDGDTRIRDGDTLIIYGRTEALSKLEKGTRVPKETGNTGK